MLHDTLVYNQGNLVHRQHYGSNSTTHLGTPTTQEYYYSIYPNPFYNPALDNEAALFMKCPGDGAGREFDYLADVHSTKLPDSIYTLYGDMSYKIRWGMHYYHWDMDSS